jgi:hypothetical protein
MSVTDDIVNGRTANAWWQDELPYEESVIRYQGIAHSIAMLNDLEKAQLVIGLALLAKEEANNVTDQTTEGSASGL